MSLQRARIACVLAAVAAPAAGCHDLPDLGTCGNGIAEAAIGEACDEGGDTTTCTAACELKCTPSAARPSYVEVAPERFCPDAGFSCGLDRICRAPSGAFAPLAPAQPFDVSGSPVLADVDNDGLDDLVGTSATNIYVRFASTRGAPLGDLVVQAAPSSDAPYAIFDLEPGATDTPGSGVVIAVPTEGVAILQSDGASFVPQLDLSIPVTGETRGFVVRDPDPALGDTVIVIPRRSANSSIPVVRVPIGAPGQPPDVPMLLLPQCTGAAAGAWQTVDIKASPDRRSFVVVTQRESAAQPAAQPWHVCRYTHQGTGWAIADFEVAPPTPSSVVLANLDGDACLELAVRSDAQPDRISMIDAVAPGCGLAAGSPAQVPFAGTGAALYAAGQVTPGGLDELVLANGVYRACTAGVDCGTSPGGTFVLVAPPTTPSPWSGAAVVDLNGDGSLDVVAARAPDADVDIVRGGGVPNVYRANTSEPIGGLVAGDFDGDRLGDVAMVETTPMADRVTVLFGTHESIVGTPRPMSSFRGKLLLDRVGEIEWIPSSRGRDGIDDLLVVDVDPQRPAAAAGLVVGDAARLMTTPRFPPMASGKPLGAVAAGAFGSNNVEVLAFTANQVQLFNVGANAWAPPVQINMTFQQPVAALRGGPALTRAAARGTGGSGRELVVFSVRGQFLMCTGSASSAPEELRGVDLENDGTDELVVFTGGMGAPRKMELFSGTCPLRPLLAEELAGCVDIANTGDRLVALCQTGMMGGARGLFEITRVGDGFVRAAAPFAELESDGRFLTAGDYDGDGVLDVAVGVNRGGVVNVQLMRQCPAHDTRSCPL
jgi:hypothetical protein